MLKISYAGCLGISPAISSQFSVEMCAASKHCEKFTKKPLFGGSRSFKVIDVNKSKKPVTSARYDKHLSATVFHNRFHTKRGNNGKITSFYGFPLEVPLFYALVQGEPFTQKHEILSR